jgi:hypothetical protein
MIYSRHVVTALELEYHLAASDTFLPTLLRSESDKTLPFWIRRAATEMCLLLAMYTCFYTAVRTMCKVLGSIQRPDKPRTVRVGAVDFVGACELFLSGLKCGQFLRRQLISDIRDVKLVAMTFWWEEALVLSSIKE